MYIKKKVKPIIVPIKQIEKPKIIVPIKKPFGFGHKFQKTRQKKYYERKRKKKKPIKRFIYRLQKKRKRIRRRVSIFKHNIPYLFKKRVLTSVFLKKYAVMRKRKIQTSIFLNPPTFKVIRYPFKLNLKLVNEYITNY